MGGLTALGRLLQPSVGGLAYYPVGGACCLPELAAGEPEAFVRAGWRRADSPRHAELLLVVGAVNPKLAPVVGRLYQQLPAPRHALLVGDCPRAEYAGASGLEAALGDARRVPGCPVDPNAIVAAVRELVP